MLKRIMAFIAAAFVLAGCFYETENPAPKEETSQIVLTMAVENDISVYAKAGVECFVRKVNEISNGSMSIEILDCSDPLDRLEAGCTLAFGSNEEFARANGNFSAYTSPFYFYDYKHLTLTLNSPEYYDIIRNGNVSLMNAMPIGAFYDGGRVILSSLEGMMFDTVSQFNDNTVNILEEQPLLELTLEEFGAEVKQRSEEYILKNFARRRDNAVVECDTLMLAELTVNEKADDCLYICKSFHSAHINWLMLSETAKNQLDSYQRAVLTEAAAFAVAENDSIVLEREQQGFEAMKMRGAEIVAPAYGEFNESAMYVIQKSAKYGSLWEWDQYTEVRNLALKQNR